MNIWAGTGRENVPRLWIAWDGRDWKEFTVMRMCCIVNQLRKRRMNLSPNVKSGWGNMIMLKNAATLQNVTAGRRFCDKILFLRRKIMSRLHMVITAIGAIFFLWFALPSFAIFSIGSVTGMALSALVVFYGIFYQRVHIFLNFLWRNFAGKTVLICMSLFLLVSYIFMAYILISVLF